GLRLLVAAQILARMANGIAGLNRLVLAGVEDGPSLGSLLRDVGLERRIIVIPALPTASAAAKAGSLVFLANDADRAEVYEKRFPKVEYKSSGVLRGMSLICEDSDVPGACAGAVPDMGLAPGGKMKQQIFEDPYDFEDWDTKTKSRVFIHLANSMAWKAITRQDPPTVPQTAADYSAYGLP
ncbi:MAG: hypothetical protein B7Z15_08420, partial [Rhizobiales bacterium 32-66-8]